MNLSFDGDSLPLSSTLPPPRPSHHTLLSLRVVDPVSGRLDEDATYTEVAEVKSVST